MTTNKPVPMSNNNDDFLNIECCSFKRNTEGSNNQTQLNLLNFNINQRSLLICFLGLIIPTFLLLITYIVVKKESIFTLF